MPLFPPLSEQEFAELAQGLVTDSAPRVFALLAEVGERADGWVAMWGLAFEDRAVLLSEPDHSLIMICDSAEQAHRRLAMRRPLRLVWPAAADPSAADGNVDRRLCPRGEASL